MTKFDFALVGFRLLILYILVTAISQLPIILNGLLNVSYSSIAYSAISFILAYVIVLAIPVLLWLYSEKIANWIIKFHDVHNELALTETNSTDLQAILFRCMGIFILVISLPSLIGGLISLNYMNNDHVMIGSIIAMSAPISKALLSLVLIFTSSSLSKLINKIR